MRHPIQPKQQRQRFSAQSRVQGQSQEKGKGKGKRQGQAQELMSRNIVPGFKGAYRPLLPMNRQRFRIFHDYTPHLQVQTH